MNPPEKKKHVHPPCFTTGTISWCVYLAKEWCSIQTGHSHLNASFDPEPMEAPMEVCMESNSRVRFLSKTGLAKCPTKKITPKYPTDIPNSLGIRNPKRHRRSPRHPACTRRISTVHPRSSGAEGGWVPLETGDFMVILWWFYGI